MNYNSLLNFIIILLLLLLFQSYFIDFIFSNITIFQTNRDFDKNERNMKIFSV
jgi:hypothetical protein